MKTYMSEAWSARRSVKWRSAGGPSTLGEQMTQRASEGWHLVEIVPAPTRPSMLELLLVWSRDVPGTEADAGADRPDASAATFASIERSIRAARDVAERAPAGRG